MLAAGDRTGRTGYLTSEAYQTLLKKVNAANSGMSSRVMATQMPTPKSKYRCQPSRYPQGQEGRRLPLDSPLTKRP